jgi:hypothetical protein
MRQIHTLLHALIGEDEQVEVGSIAEPAPQDDLPLQLKDGDACPIELHAGGLLLRLELEEHRGGHGDWCRVGAFTEVLVICARVSTFGGSSVPAPGAVRRLGALEACFAQVEWRKSDWMFFLFL